MTNFYEELKSINDKLDFERLIQKCYEYSHVRYRESIKKQIELLSQKEELLNKQHRIAMDEMEIARIKGVTDEKVREIDENIEEYDKETLEKQLRDVFYTVQKLDEDYNERKQWSKTSRTIAKEVSPKTYRNVKAGGFGTVSIDGKVINEPTKPVDVLVLESLHRIEELLKNNQTTTINVSSVDSEKAVNEVLNKIVDGVSNYTNK